MVAIAVSSLFEKRTGQSLSLPNIPNEVMPMARVQALCSPCEHRSPAELMEPFAYLCQLPGKDIRSRMVDAYNVWLQVDPAILDLVKKVVTMLHNGSLLVDDIEDHSQMRRGAPVAHAIFGEPLTINCANYTYFLALELVHNTGNPKAVKVFVDELLNLHRGQGWDIYWRDNYECPSLDMYKQMVLDKTGGLLRLAVKLMQAFSTFGGNLITLTNSIGLYYQIRDDYINLASEAYMENKSYCEDLTEGKFSYPIIHAIQANPADRRLMHILKQRTGDVNIKKHAVEYIESVGSLAHTKAVLKELETEIADEIQKLGGNGKLEMILQYLMTNLV